MTGKKWDDNKIETLLGDMPDIQDHRLQSEVLARLKQDERLKKSPQRSQAKRWLPAFVAVAALLVFSLLIPSMLRQNDSAMMDKAAEPDMIRSHKEDAMLTNEAEESAIDQESAPAAKAFNLDMARGVVENHVLLQEDIQGLNPLRIGLVENATVVPITFLIPSDRIAADFPEGEPDSVALYNEYAANIPEGEFGFEDYHPYVGEITEQDDVVVHQVPDNHPYDLASATTDVYMNSIKETFTDHATFKTVDDYGELAEFDQVGTTQRFALERPLPYYKLTMPSGQMYLTPYETGTTLTVEEALIAMKEAHNDIVEALVPGNIAYDVYVEEGIAVIAFKEPLDLMSMDQGEANAMLEGFMLTAKNFNKKLRLENVVQDTFLRYDLTTVLPEPVGVNPVYYFE